MTAPSSTAPARPWLGLLGWLLLCAAVAAIGAIASRNAPDFYAMLDRPAWSPPAALFGPVWSALYALMAVAAWLVWRARGWGRAGGALGLFVLQLFFNGLWSWLFFSWQQGALAMADIVLLWALIVLTIWRFWQVRPLAGVLLLPYLAWVSFATALTWSVWQRNPQLL